MENLERKCVGFEAEVSTARDQSANDHELLSGARGELDAARKENEALMRERSSLKDAIRAAEARASELERAVRQLEARAADEKAKLDSMQGELLQVAQDKVLLSDRAVLSCTHLNISAVSGDALNGRDDYRVGRWLEGSVAGQGEQHAEW